jgi:TolB protein
MDADGNNLINLTKHKMDDVVPSWSPDGSKIAFVSYRGGLNDPAHIFVMNADGTGRRNLTGDSDLTDSFFPTWSPDGKKIVFDSRRLFEDAHIYVITAEGENLERLTEEGNHGASPVYVLDGRKIAYVSRRGGDYNIYLMDTNGRNVVKLTRTPPGIDNKDPYWLSGAFAVNPNGKLPISWGVLKRTGKP